MILTHAAFGIYRMLRERELENLENLDRALTNWHPLRLWQSDGIVTLDLLAVQSLANADVIGRETTRQELDRVAARWGDLLELDETPF